MKRYILLAFAMVAAFSIVSCGNNRPTQEEIQDQKVALADTVLTEIDSLAAQLFDASSKSFRIRTMELTEKEKLVKPDYLLDPSLAKTLSSRSQKVRALSIYVIEQGVRKLYDMPCEEVNEVILRLIADLNFPVNIDTITSDIPLSEKIKDTYEACKENGDLSLFWQFEYVAPVEINYLISRNPDLFFSRITEQQWQAYCVRRQTRLKVIEELAKYDEEMAELLEFANKTRIVKSDEERAQKEQSLESEKQYFTLYKDKYANKRTSLLN